MTEEYDGFVTIGLEDDPPSFWAHVIRTYYPPPPPGVRDEELYSISAGFDRVTAQQVVAWTNRINAGQQDDGAALADWDGDAITLTYVTGVDAKGEPTTEVERVNPDGDGLYWIGVRSGWTWEEITS